ncbi:MAG TPA: hypothetical protein PKN36_08925 [bacterium]|nr:hypothetical protein [bacterium]
MDMKNILELLKKTSADCEKAIEKGFGTELNMLTIKEQIDSAVISLEKSDYMETPVTQESKEEIQVEKKEEAVQVEEKTEEKAKTTPTDEIKEKEVALEDAVTKLSQDVNLKPAEKKEEIEKKETEKAEYKRLPIDKPSMVQPLKSSSFSLEKNKEE